MKYRHMLSQPRKTMYKLEDIREIHLEMTEVCQAACPMCPRADYSGKINPKLSMSELTLEDCKNIFPPAFIKQLNNMFMCGTFGDPAAAKDTLAVFRYFREHNANMRLSLITNGGLRNAAWWTELASIIGTKGSAVFSVDGLRDTNHIYRQNVNWDIVEANMRTYIGAGGKARWDYLIFEHNQHQVEEARAMSIAMGFETICFKKSARFAPHVESKKESINLTNRKGEEVTISKPEEKYQNAAEKAFNTVMEKYGNAENYHKMVPIKCKATNTSSIYVSAEGLLLPCCWWHGPMYTNSVVDRRREEIWKVIDSIGGKEKLSVKNGLEQVFNSGILQTIKDSWVPGAEGRLRVCSEACGVDYDPRGAERL